MNEMDTRFANQYNIQWFPGHMTKTLRMMEQEIQHVDASLVLLDARIPLSSLNPEIERITARKPKLYALNKADLADPAVTEEWIRYFHAADAGCVAISAKQKGGANAVKVAIEKELSGLLERRQNRGMGGAKTQVMLCGIPNVGKSTFINTFAGSARAKAADRPGVTKGKQWVSTEKFDLLDMPGVLWKKFDSKTIASNLAFIGSIKDDILDVEELAMNLLDEVRRAVESNKAQKMLFILHCYGSHFSYHQRYPREFAQFRPDDDVAISREHVQTLRNAYDNSILYTDFFLSETIQYLRGLRGTSSALLYCADHGEDILDDRRERFLHASPTTTAYQLYVASLAWFSDAYRQNFPDKAAAAEANATVPATTHALFHTMADMASIRGNYIDTGVSLVNAGYDRTRPRRYLNDHNEAVPFRKTGLAGEDMEVFRKFGIEP